MRVAVIYKVEKSNFQYSAITDKLYENKKQFERLGYYCDLFYLNEGFLIKLSSQGEQKLVSFKFNKKFSSIFWNEMILRFADLREYDLSIFRYNIFTISSTWFYSALRRKYPLLKIVIELPTYPYHYEFKKLSLWVIKLIEPKNLSKYVDAIWHLGEEKEIWKVPTIKYNTYIDFDKYKIRERISSNNAQINLITVSTLWPWFGIHDFIDAFIKYIINKSTKNITLNVVGNGPMYISLSEKVKKSQLGEIIVMHGSVYSERLNSLFENMDMAIGNFGRKYQPLNYAQSIKHRHYAARGIPFAYNTVDPVFTNNNNVLFIDKESVDAKDIDEIVEWVKKNRNLLPEIAQNLRLHVESECNHSNNIKRLLKFLYH